MSAWCLYSVFIVLIFPLVFTFFYDGIISFSPQPFIMKIFKKKVERGSYSEQLYINHLGSVMNINTCFIAYISSYVVFHPSVHFDAFQNKLQASVYFPLNSLKACIFLIEFIMCLQFCFCFEVKFTYKKYTSLSFDKCKHPVTHLYLLL